MTVRIRAVCGALIAACVTAAAPRAQEPRSDPTREAVRLLTELAALPSESGNAEGVARAAAWLRERFGSLGFRTTILETEPGANPLVLAEREAEASGAPTILFYLHYDTQPTGPPQDWASTGGAPFAPRLLSGRWDDPVSRPLSVAELDERTAASARLYGRGAADDKAPIVMHLVALRRWLAGPDAGRIHLKFVLDGEEEAGSTHIASALARHGGELRADLLVLCDGPMDALGRTSVYLGARGDMHMRLTVRTAALPAHSGNYGLLPGAAWQLSRLLSTMRDQEGNVTIEGFMDDVVPPTPREREAMAAASEAEPTLAAQLGVDRFEGDPRVPYYERLLFKPGLAINQMDAGRQGNQIPNVATALLEVRLVARQDPHKVFEAVRRHIQARLPGAELEYLDGVAAGRMDPDDPAVARGVEAVRRAAASPLLVYPSLGGTLPLLSDFARAGHRYIGLPLVNPDNNQHVANENVKVEAIAKGIDLLVRLYSSLAG